MYVQRGCDKEQLDGAYAEVHIMLQSVSVLGYFSSLPATDCITISLAAPSLIHAIPASPADILHYTSPVHIPLC